MKKSEIKDENLVSLSKNEEAFDFLNKKFGDDYAKYREKWDTACRREDHFRVPVHIDLDINNICNMACVNCNAYTARALNGKIHEIDCAILKKRLSEAVPLGVKAVNIGNCSEPLTAADKMFGLINHVRQLGVIDIFIHTNGLLLTEEIVSKIIESDVTRLCISLDAAKAETYEKIGRKNFDKVVSNIRKFLEIRSEKGSLLPILRLSFCPNKYNYKEINKFKEYWKDLADVLEVQSLYDVCEDAENRELFRKSETKDCVDPWRRLVIWPNNTYGVCCQMYAFNPGCCLNLGSIREMSIEEAWESEKINEIRRSLVSKNLHHDCDECLNSKFVVGVS